MRNSYSLETKSDGDDFDEMLETVSKSVGDRTEKKVAKIITDALDPLKKDVLDIQKKMGRPGGMTGGGVVIKTDGTEVSQEKAALHNAISAYVRTGDDSEMKAMSVGNDPSGGYLVIPVMAQAIRERMFDQSPIFRLAHVENIGAGDSWIEPYDFGDFGATWVGETEDRQETPHSNIGELEVPLREIYAKPKITQKLLDDANYDVGAYIERKIGEKFGRMEGIAAVLGNTPKRPRGFLTVPRSFEADGSRDLKALQMVPSGAVSSITLDSLKALQWSLRSPYKRNASWLMNSQTAAQIDYLKDNNGQPLWRSSNTAGAPDTLLGRPVEIDDLAMPNIAANALPIAYGDFKQGYIFVQRPGFRLLKDPYTADPYVFYKCYRRVGGDVRDYDAIKLMVIQV
ncbi:MULTISPECIES: phage major capsid protein [unclassified Rhizobium]|uniref:phage major capsid protein n=1 Tax=unclassified Rhizobium TaxID=2613769 RepID=UPI000BDC3A7A|nr:MULTISPECIES: phage major capsid protein [unclassified Rhizobium]MDH7805724.1 HK97 family phage major capsid protein [Rhizobium sp. AN67]SOD59781.1 phage major capsid protein, HK97 family [Rhizobium sp. AN6A]